MNLTEFIIAVSSILGCVFSLFALIMANEAYSEAYKAKRILKKNKRQQP